MIASVLSVFNISKAKDEKGMEIDIDPDAFSTGLSRYVTVIHFWIAMLKLTGILKVPQSHLNALLPLDLFKLPKSFVRLLWLRGKTQAQHRQLAIVMAVAINLLSTKGWVVLLGELLYRHCSPFISNHANY